jgi:hypothetical protein
LYYFIVVGIKHQMMIPIRKLQTGLVVTSKVTESLKPARNYGQISSVLSTWHVGITMN